MIHSRHMRDLDQIAQPGHAEPARTPHGIAPAGLRGRVYWGTPHSTPPALVLSVVLCAMMALIHDSFMTSHALPGSGPVDVLGLDNGLVQPSFRAQCTGPPHPVRHSSESGMLFTVICSPSFATRS